MTKLTWHGHGTWLIETGENRILLDPFFTENPSTETSPDDVQCDHILISHGHFDHIDDAPTIAKRTGAKVITNFEIAQWLEKNHDVQDCTGMNLGGGIDLPFGRVEMTQAWHSSSLPDGSYGGNPAGFLLTLPEGNVYFACDTGLFGDMKQIGRGGIQLAILPIGDLFTMGPEASLEAINLLQPKQVAPAHYNTWPPIEQDADRWAEKVKAHTQAEPVVLKVGDTIDL